MHQLLTLSLRALAIFSLVVMGSPLVKAQQFNISGGDISTCAGVLEDTGGPTGQYGNNEDFTVTICSDVPGDAISLNWVVFDLSQQLPNPLDRIRIWDGNSTAANFIGEYTGTALQGLISSSSIYNISGCLTVQFTSNSGGVGNFAAGITCYTPCERPTAVATMSEPTPALICVGEEVSFDGTGSHVAAGTGFSLVEYNWNFDDGTIVDSPTATHSWSEPGEYVVQLNLVDDNGCVNANVVDLQVLVSTTPVFAGTMESTETCLGATVDLNAVVTPVTWTGIPEANFGDGVYLPDDLGIPFTSELVFTQFDPGQTVTSTSDIISVCANMEHSFLGDLVVQLTCPGGQTMIMHQQGGGGTYIGGANDNDGANPQPGDCWQYCWSPTATLGTWAQSANNGSSPHVMQGGTPSNNALIPDTYSSVQPFTNLIGCPLNGTWTFTITDLWGADNGFLCDWSLNFNPAIIPDATQFTPVLGTVIDSAGWTGPALVTDPTNAMVGQATPTGPGSYDYNFYVTDNFGCTYDTTITITIDPQMVVDAGPGFTLCNDSLPMAGVITANVPSVPVTYAWTPTTGLADASDPHTLVWVTDPTWYFLSVHPVGQPDCSVMDSVLIYPPLPLDPGEDGTAVVCESSLIFLMTDSLGGTPDLDGVWSSAQGTEPDNFNPATHVPGSYTYTYTVVTSGGCTATSQLEVTVTPDTDPTCCGIPDAGEDNYSCDLSIALSATPGNTGVGEWSGPAGAVFADALAPSTIVTMPPGGGGSHWFYWRENDGVYCNTVDSVLMTFTDAIEMTFTTTDAVCFTYCDGTAQVAITGGNVVDDFTYAWSGGNVGSTPDSVSGLCAGNYLLTLTDDNGCSATDSLSIGEPVLLQIDSTASLPVTCSGDCDGQVMIYDGEAVEYSFNGGAAWAPSAVLTDACEGLYQLRIRDAAGCMGIGSIMVTGPPPVVADFEWGPIPATVENPILYFHSTSTGSQSYLWDIAGLASSTSMDTSFIFSNKEPGIYRVCLTAYNYNNCPDSTCYDVEIEDVLEPYIPNAFTPNGDDKNDVFFMSTNIPTITDFEMLIYDRWGQLVFSTQDPYEPWLGSKNNSGAVLASGVYVYRIRYEVARLQTKKEMMGHVTLLK